MDELEIYPMRIVETALAIVNPFHEDTSNKDYLLFEQPDLAGPILFGFVLGAALTLSGGETRFGCIYGIRGFGFRYVLYRSITGRILTGHKNYQPHQTQIGID